MKCRHCGTTLKHRVLDLGDMPPSNAYIRPDELEQFEPKLPLKVNVCHQCFLVQTEDFTRADALFTPDYAYFSSTSQSWLKHAATFSRQAIDRFGLSETSFVVELASNDGYLLRNFSAAHIPCLGVEPTKATADAAEHLGIPQWRDFFGLMVSDEIKSTHGRADLIIGNNVLAHVPDINDFVAGAAHLLKPGGTISFEFPHLLNLLRECQFDTIYHEHFSYLSLIAVRAIAIQTDLKIIDVAQLPTHGGSLRVFLAHAHDPRAPSGNVGAVLQKEINFGLMNLSTYKNLQPEVDRIKDELVQYLADAKRAGKSIWGYGAAAKGNTLLNYAKIKPDLVPMIADAAPSKQGKYMPGSHIPIVSPPELIKAQPDVILILPWNIAPEIMQNLQPELRVGTEFAWAIPRLTTKQI
ncbi:class I SAM-dependent methyltransferase [Maritalea mediterranea]|uniref:Class I SAM-dependent methyltransferase n=1 Tax=Maritalea mediterranea TaxID=2909667 RepID=A0ABS9E4B4_9HYPH|nr:class I SAM-dependent methyltransferase [Maritalea mediterranea]MCF4097691.1 class I SAM-dependent methyltransferase [Maritalea mediterranea]